MKSCESSKIMILLYSLPALGIFAAEGNGCTLGRSDLPPTSPNPTPGLFIDGNNSSPCNGQIIQWSICYYNPRNFSTRDSIRIRLQTWRLNGTHGLRISSYLTTLSIPKLPAYFQCVNITVDPSDYVDVKQGDYIGVNTFNNSVLPVIANTADGSRVFFLPANANDVMRLSNQAIHVSATIVTSSSEVTPEVINPTSSTNPTQQSTINSSEDQVDQELSTPLGTVKITVIVIVLPVIVLLIVIAVTLLVVAGVVWYVATRRKNTFSIDNAAYELPVLHQPKNQMTIYHNMSTTNFFEAPTKTITRTENRDHERLESLCSSVNPYASLRPMVLKEYYNTYFQHQTADHIYTIPDVPVEAPYSEPPSNEEDIYKELFKRTRTINRKSIKILKKVGEGTFSSVSKGSWTDGNSVHEVAVKELINQSTKEEKIKMLQEAAILGQFRHPNIVNLFGVVKHGSAPMIVTEFLHKSDLLNVLLSMAPDPGQLVATDTPELLLSYSQQVSLGMHYLSSKGFVHRDLAARNIFVTKDDICKVGDFGLSRELANTEYYVSHGGVVPVRWTAPEAIFYRKYSSASDVWSYGCLLYEIWTLGIKPYDGIDPTKYLETLLAGYRLPPPSGCPLVIYRTMIECWHPKANERPPFTHILSVLLNETLSIPINDASSHLQACQLGAGLEAGLDMYKDLQNTYLKKVQIPKQKHRTVTSSQKPPKILQTSILAPAEENIYEAVHVLEK